MSRRGSIFGTSLPLMLFLVMGCSEEFNPVTEGERPYVVFALLNTSVPVQIVRVHETAPPTETNPGHPAIPGTVVRMTGPEGLLSYRDTVLMPPAGSNDTLSVSAFVLEPFTPLRGQTYTLDVESPRGNAHSTVTIPGPGDLVTNDFLVIRAPYSYPPDRSIVTQALLSPAALGFVVRYVLEYERLVSGVWVLETTEVPRTYVPLGDGVTFVPEYPSLLRRTSTINTVPGGVRNRESVLFRNSTYLRTLALLYVEHGADNLRMKRALLILTQADTHFFTYYSFANFFQDKLTIRVDQPDYSNVTGALGFFGSMTTDTLAFILPVDLSPAGVVGVE